MTYSINNELSSSRISKRLSKLFPIHRTLVNRGYLESLEILKEELPLEIKEYPSGQKVFDWEIPNSWNVRKAQISDINGKVLVDFKDSNLHLSAYSTAYNGKISHEELLNHLNFRKDLPKAIPYNFHYYNRNWSFNITYESFNEQFVEEEYIVTIEIDEFEDYLRVGEYLLEGESKEEFWITTYMCHPSMVNDNLSGVCVAVELFKYLSNLKSRKYSYRLLIVPETIGAISYLANNEALMTNVKGGFTVYCCADSGKINYKKSYFQNAYIDKVFEYTFENLLANAEFGLLDFWPGGSDERQFNSPGIRLPMGAVTRTPAAEFKEYHTSLDNLELIDVKDIIDSLQVIYLAIGVVESDSLYKNNYKGEPCFSRHNIKYPSFVDALEKSSAYNVKILASETDGKSSLLEIAKKWKLNVFHLADIARSFEKENLFIKIL